jgi:hypothetical protein
LANPEHLAKLREGVESWGQWRKQNSEVLPDLHGAYLGGRSSLLGAIPAGEKIYGIQESQTRQRVMHEFGKGRLPCVCLRMALLSAGYRWTRRVRRRTIIAAMPSAARESVLGSGVGAGAATTL